MPNDREWNYELTNMWHSIFDPVFFLLQPFSLPNKEHMGKSDSLIVSRWKIHNYTGDFWSIRVTLNEWFP